MSNSIKLNNVKALVRKNANGIMFFPSYLMNDMEHATLSYKMEKKGDKVHTYAIDMRFISVLYKAKKESSALYISCLLLAYAMHQNDEHKKALAIANRIGKTFTLPLFNMVKVQTLSILIQLREREIAIYKEAKERQAHIELAQGFVINARYKKDLSLSYEEKKERAFNAYLGLKQERTELLEYRKQYNDIINRLLSKELTSARISTLKEAYADIVELERLVSLIDEHIAKYEKMYVPTLKKPIVLHCPLKNALVFNKMWILKQRKNAFDRMQEHVRNERVSYIDYKEHLENFSELYKLYNVTPLEKYTPKTYSEFPLYEGKELAQYTFKQVYQWYRYEFNLTKSQAHKVARQFIIDTKREEQRKSTFACDMSPNAIKYRLTHIAYDDNLRHKYSLLKNGGYNAFNYESAIAMQDTELRKANVRPTKRTKKGLQTLDTNAISVYGSTYKGHTNIRKSTSLNDAQFTTASDILANAIQEKAKALGIDTKKNTVDASILNDKERAKVKRTITHYVKEQIATNKKQAKANNAKMSIKDICASHALFIQVSATCLQVGTFAQAKDVLSKVIAKDKKRIRSFLIGGIEYTKSQIYSA